MGLSTEGGLPMGRRFAYRRESACRMALWKGKPPVNRMADRCKTLPSETSFAGGNKTSSVYKTFKYKCADLIEEGSETGYNY